MVKGFKFFLFVLLFNIFPITASADDLKIAVIKDDMPTSDVEVLLFDENCLQLLSRKTEENGVVSFDVESEGTYYYYTEAPEGYQADEFHKVVLKDDEVKQVLTLEKIPDRNLELSADSDLRILSNLLEEDYEKMLEGTALAGIGKALVRVEQEHGINGLYMMGLACLESGWGESSLARNKNNLVGWNACDGNTKGATAFSSKEECLLTVAPVIKQNYLTEGGKYFHGFSARAIDVKYCSDKRHADKIISIVHRLIQKL